MERPPQLIWYTSFSERSWKALEVTRTGFCLAGGGTIPAVFSRCTLLSSNIPFREPAVLTKKKNI